MSTVSLRFCTSGSAVIIGRVSVDPAPHGTVLPCPAMKTRRARSISTQVPETGDGTGYPPSAETPSCIDARIDLSERMLTLAARHRPRRVQYCRASAETFALAAESLDLVVSSLALHYV